MRGQCNIYSDITFHFYEAGKSCRSRKRAARDIPAWEATVTLRTARSEMVLSRLVCRELLTRPDAAPAPRGRAGWVLGQGAATLVPAVGTARAQLAGLSQLSLCLLR